MRLRCAKRALYKRLKSPMIPLKKRRTDTCAAQRGVRALVSLPGEGEVGRLVPAAAGGRAGKDGELHGLEQLETGGPALAPPPSAAPQPPLPSAHQLEQHATGGCILAACVSFLCGECVSFLCFLSVWCVCVLSVWCVLAGGGIRLKVTDRGFRVQGSGFRV